MNSYRRPSLCLLRARRARHEDDRKLDVRRGSTGESRRERNRVVRGRSRKCRAAGDGRHGTRRAWSFETKIAFALIQKCVRAFFGGGILPAYGEGDACGRVGGSTNLYGRRRGLMEKGREPWPSKRSEMENAPEDDNDEDDKPDDGEYIGEQAGSWLARSRGMSGTHRFGRFDSLYLVGHMRATLLHAYKTCQVRTETIH